MLHSDEHLIVHIIFTVHYTYYLCLQSSLNHFLKNLKILNVHLTYLCIAACCNDLYASLFPAIHTCMYLPLLVRCNMGK